jgi:8-oxo-dGTP pyrophosphatase MutT (NUDIX family)
MEKSPFEVVIKDGYHAIRSENSSVAVLLYTRDEQGILDKVGIIVENNPHFPEKSYTGLIMGTVESEDPSLLARAKQEAKEEGGYEVENDRWDFLGEIYTSKLFPESIYCYSADITGLSGEKPMGDGSVHEKGIKFSLVPLSKVEKIPDSILQSCFFKLFSKLYKNQLV